MISYERLGIEKKLTLDFVSDFDASLFLNLYLFCQSECPVE